ncbi:MAG: outer membrane lipoprotein carrier protein LolA [Elusimicrobiota bacterium]|jgi:outer membrane lipoprotein carrier protein|nr:outer membrane lipoprotein carrier protein LolA [Elusimicrobiota bacterium]
MKKVLLFLIILFVSINAYTAEPFEVFARFAVVSSIEADFKAERTVQISQKPFVSAGKIYFQKPNHLRWEYLSPIKYAFVNANNKTHLIQYDAQNKKIVKDITNRQEAKAADYLNMFVSMDMKIIEELYNIKILSTDKDSIVLSPKNDSDKQIIDKIQIFLSKKEIAVERVEIIYKNTDKTIITFANIKINQKLPANVFNI